ncbi:MAG: hypothetical protein WC536_02640 [Patescibacteria group bacterium]
MVKELPVLEPRPQSQNRVFQVTEEQLGHYAEEMYELTHSELERLDRDRMRSDEAAHTRMVPGGV